MIEIRQLSQSYGEKQVLNDVSIVIPEKKITALIGANGAGKSTLVNVISRLLNPSKGEVLIDGVDIKNLKTRDIAKRLAILKQSNPLQVRLSVRDLVAFGRYPHSLGHLNAFDHQKSDECLAYLDLVDVQDRFIDQLSGGQKQRAYIAMILAQDTEYVFLDEPLNNLDMRYAVEMMNILQRLVKDFNKTIVVVVHDINIAATFADHIIAMKGGEILYEGETNDIIEKDILDHVYDHDFCVECINGQKVCMYKAVQS